MESDEWKHTHIYKYKNINIYRERTYCRPQFARVKFSRVAGNFTGNCCWFRTASQARSHGHYWLLASSSGKFEFHRNGQRFGGSGRDKVRNGRNYRAASRCGIRLRFLHCHRHYCLRFLGYRRRCFGRTRFIGSCLVRFLFINHISPRSWFV